MEILGALSCLILCAGFIYYGYRLRLHVQRLSPVSADQYRPSLGYDSNLSDADTDTTMRIMSDISGTP